MTEKKLEWVLAKRWKEHFEYPTDGTMRVILANRKKNGAENFLSKVNGRFYINVNKFNEWMESHSLKTDS